MLELEAQCNITNNQNNVFIAFWQQDPESFSVILMPVCHTLNEACFALMLASPQPF